MRTVILGLGLLLIGAGGALVVDLGGSARWLIRNLTSRSLGALAPGYAATPFGMRAFALLLATIGLGFAGLGIAFTYPRPGVMIGLVGLAGFVATSVVVITGEVRTYRSLSKR